MVGVTPQKNIDPATVAGFGEEWAALVHPRVGQLHCIDPSEKALGVTRRRLAGVDAIPLADGSQDFGYSLGVLHHIPDTGAAMRSCVAKLKPGAPFLVYLYYDFDNRPAWFRTLWRASEVLRAMVWRLPFPLRKGVTGVLAAIIYWPLARLARRLGLNPETLPLSAYERSSFRSMRTDSLDRFGTRLEQRFSREEIKAMMTASSLAEIVFSDAVPYWVAVGRKAG